MSDDDSLVNDALVEMYDRIHPQSPKERLIEALHEGGFTGEHFRCLANAIRFLKYRPVKIAISAAEPDDGAALAETSRISDLQINVLSQGWLSPKRDPHLRLNLNLRGSDGSVIIEIRK